MKGKITTYILVFFLLLTACVQENDSSVAATSSNENITLTPKSVSVREPIEGTASLEEMIAQSLNNIYSVSIRDSLKIQERVKEDDITFSSFTFSHHDIIYYGVTSAWENDSKWFKLSMNVYKNFEDQPASIIKFSGEAMLPNQNKRKQSYQMIYGYLNNKDIKRVIVRYKGGKISVIQIGQNQKVYMDYNLIPQEVLDVQLQDEKGKVILKEE
ncbi:hypothetical protein [Saccharibacillus sp. JS10]|uniref:hypothetical protein n=1 Tax=Saccharibacillus sp. JS10 TaxID=2950552 RepID=UPI00210CC7D7|nr:hypothetical protein [Saccharibacillus sp. JS10]MCQ4088222.1 hypothetical protein [Saccharibacillus sp. JS10]